MQDITQMNKEEIYKEVIARIQIIRRKLYEGAECRLAELQGINDRLRESGTSYKYRVEEMKKKNKDYYEKIIIDYKKPVKMRPLHDWFDWDSFERMGIDTYVSVFWKIIIE